MEYYAYIAVATWRGETARSGRDPREAFLINISDQRLWWSHSCGNGLCSGCFWWARQFKEYGGFVRKHYRELESLTLLKTKKVVFFGPPCMQIQDQRGRYCINLLMCLYILSLHLLQSESKKNKAAILEFCNTRDTWIVVVKCIMFGPREFLGANPIKDRWWKVEYLHMRKSISRREEKRVRNLCY